MSRLTTGPSSSLTSSRCFSSPPSTSYGDRRSALSPLTVKTSQTHSEGASSSSEHRARSESVSGSASTDEAFDVAASSGAARPQALPDARCDDWIQGMSIGAHVVKERRTEEERHSAWDLLRAQISSFLFDVDQALGGLYASLLGHRLHSLQRSLGTAAVCSLLTAVILTSAPPGIAITQVLETPQAWLLSFCVWCRCLASLHSPGRRRTGP